MLNSLIAFIVKYEYARALFDKQASSRFIKYQQVHELFDKLAFVELNHAHRLEKLLDHSVVPSRNQFIQYAKSTEDGNDQRFLDGISVRKIWAKFLFSGKRASEWELEDTLAFCAAAERLESIGYSVLSFVPRCRSLAKAIRIEESNAENKILKLLMNSSLESPLKTRLLIFKWYAKAFVSMVVLAFTLNK